MAEQLASLRKNDTLTETVLWTNPNPDNPNGFNNATITLSQDINNFSEIRFYYKGYYANLAEVYITVPVLLVKASVATTGRPLISLGARGEGASFARVVMYNSDTSIIFTNAAQLNLTNTQNTYAIPTKICGLK